MASPSFRRLVGALAGSVVALQLVTVAPAAAAYAAADASATEPAVSGSISFEVTRALTDPATVDYHTVDGTAEAGSDYVATSGTVVFRDDETVREVRVPLLADALNETGETFTLQLSRNGGNVGSATGTIFDDNDPEPRVSAGGVIVDEGNNAVFPVTLSRPSGRQITVNYETGDGSAKAGADYTATNAPPLVFEPGEISKSVTVPTLPDALDEADETFILTLSLPAGAPAEIGDGTGTAVVLDDDGQPSVSIADASGAEGPGGPKVTFTVSLSAASGRDVTVTATPINGTATAGSDFEAGSQQVVVPAGQTSATFDIGIVDNAVHESTETFSVVLTIQSNALAGDTEAIGTITDNDAGPVLTIDDVSTAEGSVLTKLFNFTVTLTGATSTAVTVDWATANGTAQRPADFTTLGGQLTFLPGPGPQTQIVPVSVVSDTLAEGDETFSVNLSNAQGGASIGDATGAGTILNDDGPPVVIAVDDAPAVAESGTAAFTVRRVSGPATQAAAVSFATKDGTARAGQDYTALNGVVAWAANDTAAKTVSVTLLDDALDEEDTEAFTLELSDPINVVFENGDASAAGTINDNDAVPTVSVVATSLAEGNSGSNPGDVEVRLSAPSGREVKVSFAVTPGTAVTPADYTPAPASGTLTFAAAGLLPGETVKTVRINVAGDSLDEDDETLTVGLSAAVNATVPVPNGTVTVTDDDVPPTVAVESATLQEPEAENDGDHIMVFSVRLSAVSGRDVTVDASTDISGADTAESGDFTDRNNAEVLIPAGSLTPVPSEVPDNCDTDIPDPCRPEFQVEIRTDADSADEIFTVTLSSPTNATLDPDATATTGTILDDDGLPRLRVEPFSVAEGVSGGKATVTVRMVPSSSTPVTVGYATAAGTATAPGDFTSTSGNLTFAAGDTVETFTVDIAADALDEADETFTAELVDPAPAGTEFGQQSATVTIVDDDGPNVSVADVSVAEGDSGTTAAVFKVTLSGSSAQPVTVSYSTAGGTAGFPADFTATSGTLTFAANETSKDVSVPVVGDTLDEADEDFVLNVFDAVNATAGAPGRATIVDDDQPDITVTGAEGVTAPDPIVVEGDFGTTPMTFTVRLDAPTTREVSVSYALGGGTASAGADYVASAGKLTFAPGETVKEVVVAVVGDDLDEAAESVLLSLFASANGTILDAQTVGTITDDDLPGYTLVASDGGIFSFGDAGFYGSTGAMKLNQPIVGMAAHPSGRGYWLVASDGGIFSFGEAKFHGSTGAMKLNKPIVGMAATLSGQGYWLVASDGGIFAFGDAVFRGSTGALTLNKPIVGMAAAPGGTGYWLVASDGGIFAFGPEFYGSTGALKLNQPIVGMAPAPSGKGYWLVASDGGIFAFGDAEFLGSTGAIKLNRPVVGMATL